MPEFWRDVRYGLRLLWRSPVFALTVSLLLGIGIGANTLIFSFFDALLLRPLPVPHPEQLVRLIEVRSNGFTTWDFPFELYEQLLLHASSPSEVLCQGDLDVAFKDGEATERIRANAVSSDFFTSLGIHAQLGRVLAPDDDKAGVTPAVLSYDFWQRRFAGSPSVIGRSINLNGRAFTIIGVLPRGVNGLSVDTSPDIRVSVTAGRMLVQQTSIGPPDPLRLEFQIFWRLRPGTTLTSAEAEIEPLLRHSYEDALIRAFPRFATGLPKELLGSRLRLEPAGNGISSLRVQFSRGLALLMASVGLLLLLACANVACLLLARSAAHIGGDPVANSASTPYGEPVACCAGRRAGSFVCAYVQAVLLLTAVPPIRDRAAVLQPEWMI